MPATLEEIATRFLADKAYRQLWTRRIANRDVQAPNVRSEIREFVGGRINLATFRSRLDYYLPKQAWDSSNRKNSREWLMAELCILERYHDTSAERELRLALNGTNAHTIGQKIGQFHGFLERERDRFEELHLPGRPMAPLNAALMISLLASITDPGIYFCDVYLRRGLSVLDDVGAIRLHDDLFVAGDTIEIRSAADYEQVKQALDQIVERVPQLNTSPAWSEIFTRWLNDTPLMPSPA